MIISIIAAMDENRGIGMNNQLPWHLPADLIRFKRLTMGHHMLVGRKTFQSIGSPLPGRQMVILTRNQDFQAPGCLRAASLEEGLSLARDAGEKEIFVIGGSEVYQEALPMADHLYLTVVHKKAEVDTFFPEFDEAEWLEVCSQDVSADEKNSLPTTFKHFVRR